MDQGNSRIDHDVSVSQEISGRVIAATNAGICRSDDFGNRWTDLRVDSTFDWGYCRGIKAIGQRLLVGNGPPGDQGAIRFTDDQGQTWHTASLPTNPNSTIWEIAAAGSGMNEVYAYSVSGQVFRSLDSGENWAKTEREFGEIRSILPM